MTPMWIGDRGSFSYAITWKQTAFETTGRLYFGMGDPKYYGVTGDRIWDSRFFLGPSPGFLLVPSAHRAARGARGVEISAYGEGPKNWLLHRRPSAIVGHAHHLGRVLIRASRIRRMICRETKTYPGN